MALLCLSRDSNIKFGIIIIFVFYKIMAQEQRQAVKTFKFNFDDKKSGKKFVNIEPMWTLTVDGKHQSLLVYETEPPTVLASLPIDRPKQELWDLAKEKIQKLAVKT